MLRTILLAAMLAAGPALAAPEGATPDPAPSAATVNEAPAQPSAQATYDLPTAAPGDAPSSPTIVDANGDVLVTGSVGASSRPVPPPARLCVAPHGACALPPVTGPGQVCECFMFGIGSEQGIAE